MYKALEYFTDNLDKGYAYNVGDVYPREGYTPTEERIEELAGTDNARRRPVIEAVTKTVAEVTEEDTVDKALEEEVKPKRKRKKAE